MDKLNFNYVAEDNQYEIVFALVRTMNELIKKVNQIETDISMIVENQKSVGD